MVGSGVVCVAIVANRVLIITIWKINGKCYIGKTIQNFEQYKKYHIATSKNKKHKTYNKVLYKAFRKYGINNFEWEIITQCNALDELNKNEIYYIEYFDSINNGYNLYKKTDNSY